MKLHGDKSRTVLFLWLLLVGLFCFSLFKNISYPLLWNDEGDTVVLSDRTLKYGYPRVDDGRNELYLAQTDRNIGIHAPTGALLYGGSWLKFYVGAVGVWLAQQTEDIYMKTGILRTEFALFGLIGLAVLALGLSDLYREQKGQRYRFLLLFTFFELLSLPLILHLREVRHYSLLILLTSAIFCVYIHGQITRRISATAMSIWMILLLWLLFNTFYPTYFIFLISLLTFECLNALQRWRRAEQKFWKGLTIPSVVLLFSLLTVLPLLLFFRSVEISNAISQELRFGWQTYVKNLKFIFTYFTQYEYFYLALGTHFFARRIRRRHWKTCDSKKVQEAVVNLMIIFFIVHVVLIARSPHMFQRYLITLQPILTGILVLDILTLWEGWFFERGAIRKRRWSTTLQAVLLGGIFLFSTTRMVGPLQGHTTSLFHQYKGPLDYAIPFIKNSFPSPSDLVIATNYEEPCLIYYLNCRVILGYYLHHLKRDHEEVPDIIIHRKLWTHPVEIFTHYFKKADYYSIGFPVLDYPTNNIPDLQYIWRHLFVTPKPMDLREALWISIHNNHQIPGIPLTNINNISRGKEKDPL